MKTKYLLCALLVLAAAATSATAKVKIVASTSDLGSIAEIVGGDNVKVDVIARGNMDPHYIELLPSYMVKVARADIYLKAGVELDYWADQIIDGSGNGGLDIVDCSLNIAMLEVPTVRVNASMGDIHTQGNPHYWLDPDNGLIIAETIVSALKRTDPKNADAYDAGLAAFRDRIELKRGEWRDRAEGLAGLEIVTYHNSWPYFSRAFGVKVVGFVEPKPGIEPSPTHTAKIIALVEERGIKLIGREPYYSDRAPSTIARQTGATVIVMPTSVGGVEAAKDYFSLFDTLLSTLTKSQ